MKTVKHIPKEYLKSIGADGLAGEFYSVLAQEHGISIDWVSKLVRRAKRGQHSHD